MAHRLKLAIIGDPHLATPREGPGTADPYLDLDLGRKLHRQSALLLDAVIDAVNAEPELDGALLLGDMSDRSGNIDVWLRDLESGRDSAITVDPASDLRGLISPNGTKVAFSRRGDAGTDVYLTELGRGGERLILKDVGFATDWTRDGKKVLFYTNSPIRWKTIDVTTGAEQDLGLEHDTYPVHSVRLSPNQDWAAFKLMAERPALFLSPLTENRTKTAENWVPLGGTGSMNSGLSWWSPDGNTLYFLSDQDEFLCIWAQPRAPVTNQPHGPPSPVMHCLERARIVGAGPFGTAMTADKLYLPIGETKGNIWLAAPRPAN
jgi:Tol biopolymer transport system component